MSDSNIWWTRKSKIHHESRLLKLERHSQLLLIWYSFFTLCASILSSSASTRKIVGMDSSFDPNLLTAFSILTLIMSCFVSSLNFKERAIKIKNCYEELASLSNIDSDAKKRYSEILGRCENHTEMDFLYAKFNIYYSIDPANRKDPKYIDKTITMYEYIKIIINFSSYYLTIISLYLLPILILIIQFNPAGV
ncbi:SLATT domain-containing protein [Acinetobacter nosocomialis]|uniref:SLATT domain-containing protein n=1 Tax=Acinetobacter nosocomialis TaxID=106654 RepID=UPI001ADBE298|nr:SLATT domain-containing protein [Acinetobacter nosocomialis]MBO8210554.1 SLATT domain-containing protein [Acinetobacter nosocomialis]MBO8227007.1 SLATT domain-containing protein [Acinetobacter nosocomialis]MBO8252411.1 SLATT domain-containing protein [Acinetobacter nosocomialis]